MRWAELEAGALDIATLAHDQFEATGMALLGTVRRDGSPRVSCIYPCLLEGDLYLGMMWRSRKAVDLLSDPRLVVHNAIWTNRGDEVEVILRGSAAVVDDEETKGRYLAAVPGWGSRRFHLFRVDLESASVIRYENGVQRVTVWPRGVEFQRPY